MRWARPVAIACLLAGCAATTPPGNELRISGFRQGLMDPAAGQGIYLEGNSFDYRVNGKCRAAGSELPCMGHGFEFDFESPEMNTAIPCKTQFERAVRAVNIHEIVKVQTNSQEWTLRLQGQKGRKVQFQYIGRGPEGSHTTTTRCLYNGREVLSWSFTVRWSADAQ